MSLQLYSGKAERYAQFRWPYDERALEALIQRIALPADALVADLGAGPATLSSWFAARGFRGVSVEPDADMRAAAERRLAAYPRWSCSDGCAEASGLADNSVDLVVIGRALHWFEPQATRIELQRILRPRGVIAVIGVNAEHSPVDRALQPLEHDLGLTTEAGRDSRRRARLQDYCDPAAITSFTVTHPFTEDLAQLIGRLSTYSSAPLPGSAGYQRLAETVGTLFERHAVDGRVTLQLQTRISYGRLQAGFMPRLRLMLRRLRHALHA